MRRKKKAKSREGKGGERAGGRGDMKEGGKKQRKRREVDIGREGREGDEKGMG